MQENNIQSQDILNANNAEVVQPQEENMGANNGDFTQSQEENDEVKKALIPQPGDLDYIPASSAPFKQYTTKDEWQADIDRIIGTRLKDSRTEKQAVENYSKMLDTLKGYYKTDNANSALESFTQDFSSPKDEGQISEKRLNEIKEQVEAICAKQNEFNLSTELNNPSFRQLVFKKGLDVESAYYLANREKMIADAVSEAEAALATSIASRAMRVSENGVVLGTGTSVRIDPSSLRDEDIDRIFERVKQGEKITL